MMWIGQTMPTVSALPMMKAIASDGGSGAEARGQRLLLMNAGSLVKIHFVGMDHTAIVHLVLVMTISSKKATMPKNERQ